MPPPPPPGGAYQAGWEALMEVQRHGHTELEASVALEENDFDVSDALSWLSLNAHRFPPRTPEQQRQIAQLQESARKGADDGMPAPDVPPPSSTAFLRSRIDRNAAGLLSEHACEWAVALVNAAHERRGRLSPEQLEAA